MKLELRPVSINISTALDRNGFDYDTELRSSDGTRINVSGNSGIDTEIKNLLAVISAGAIVAKLIVDVNVSPEPSLDIAGKLIKNNNPEAAAWLLKQTVLILERES